MRDTIDMAREAGWDDHHAEFDTRLDRLVALVRADEREAFAKIQFESLLQAIRIEREQCAKVADLVAREIDDTNGVATYIAAAIRARSKNDPM
jgi:hypothetical protein